MVGTTYLTTFVLFKEIPCIQIHPKDMKWIEQLQKRYSTDIMDVDISLKRTIKKDLLLQFDIGFRDLPEIDKLCYIVSRRSIEEILKRIANYGAMGIYSGDVVKILNLPKSYDAWKMLDHFRKEEER